MKTIDEIIERAARRRPDAIALVCGEKNCTYADFWERIEHAANFFARHCSPGSVIALHAENSLEWLVAYFGILRARCIANPIGIRVSDETLGYQIRFSRARMLLLSERVAGRAKRIRIPEKTRTVNLQEIARYSARGKAGVQQRQPARYASLMYTSGTTAAQKAIRLPHLVVLAATRNIVDCLGLEPDDRYYQILPLSHSFGLGNVHATFAAGGSVIISNNTINLGAVLSDLSDRRATFFAATPLTLSLMVEHFMNELLHAGRSLRVVCTNTGPMPREVTRRILKKLPRTQFYTYYGLTEASRSTFMHYNAHPEKLESVGVPVRGSSIRIIGESGRTIRKPRTFGEICVKGPHVVNEYWRNPHANRSLFRRGYLKTGDVGFFDGDGFLYVSGRTDDVVNIAGEKVSLQEIDATLQKLSFVRDVMCIERPDSRQEYAIVAHVVLDPAKKIAENEAREKIIAHSKRMLDNYKVPREVHFHSALPRTDAGKAKRRDLRARPL